LLISFGTYNQRLFEFKKKHNNRNASIKQINNIQKNEIVPWGSDIPLSIFIFILTEAAKSLNPNLSKQFDMETHVNNIASFHYQNNLSRSINDKEKLLDNLESIKE